MHAGACTGISERSDIPGSCKGYPLPSSFPGRGRQDQDFDRGECDWEEALQGEHQEVGVNECGSGDIETSTESHLIYLVQRRSSHITGDESSRCENDKYRAR